MIIATVLLLEDVGADYHIVVELNVEAEPGRDSCLSGSPDGQCCVTQIQAQDPVINASHLYGLVIPEQASLPDGPNMIQTHNATAGRGYQFNSGQYRPMNGMLRKTDLGTVGVLPVKMFQFIIGEFKLMSKNAFIHPS